MQILSSFKLGNSIFNIFNWCKVVIEIWPFILENLFQKIIFQHWLIQSYICSPSKWSLVTKQFPWNGGVSLNNFASTTSMIRKMVCRSPNVLGPTRLSMSIDPTRNPNRFLANDIFVNITHCEESDRIIFEIKTTVR